MMYRKYIKVFFDKLLAIVLIGLFFPLITLTVLIVYFKIGKPILFKQQRPGLNEKLFSIYKFRTMTDTYDTYQVLLNDEERITKTGRFLRKLSLDELPQLFNVLKGDMSFVGPRPLLVEYLTLYNDEQCKRQEVLPGITGWAQVNGRNAISWEEKFKYDVWYVEHQSFLLDLKILWMTLLTVLKQKNITDKENVTMEKFEGTSHG